MTEQRKTSEGKQAPHEKKPLISDTFCYNNSTFRIRRDLVIRYLSQHFSRSATWNSEARDNTVNDCVVM